jgi:anti-sigma B factor antagonist
MTRSEPQEESGATPRIKTVDLTGDIDVTSAGELGDWLSGLVTGGYDEVVVTCAQVSFVESRGLAMMARVQRFADEAGCHLRWRELPLHVLRTIHLTGLDTYLRIEA